MKLLFIDPGSGERVTYDDLRERLAAPTVTLRPCLRPATPGQAVVGLLMAVALGRPLTLVDADISDEELAALDVSAETLNETQVEVGHRWGTSGEMIAAARRAEGFKLTLFTSGSTGLPKRVTHSLEGLTRMLRVGDKHAENVWGLAYNPTHIAGVQVVLQAFFNGNPLVHLFGAARETVVERIERFAVTHLSATPSFYRLLLPPEKPLRDVRAVTLGGERSDTRLIERLRELFPEARLRNLYASTEAGTLLAAEGDVFEIPTELADGVRVRDGRLEIHRALLGDIAGADVEGEWYETGDVVEIVAEAPRRFRIMSRERDWVNVGGHKVNPAEVEDALLAFPGVREARVAARKNSVLGEMLVAEVVAAPVPTEAELRSFMAARLQPVKVPRVIRFVAELPRSRTGKRS